MSPTTNTSNEDQDHAKARRYTRFGITSACVVVGALIFEAKVACRAHRTTEALAELAIAVGVIGEVVFHHIAGKASERLLGRSEARVRELERLNEPRRLSVEQKARIAGKLKPFASTRYTAGVNTTDPEVIDLLEDIRSSLEEADWVEVDAPPNVTNISTRAGTPFISTRAKNRDVIIGVISREPRENVATIADAAQSAAEALASEGIGATFDFAQGVPHEVEDRAIIKVMVGPKSVRAT
jgi:hypothetical protein